MANQLVTLLDVTKRKGNDQVIGLLEDTLTYAPELGAIMGRPIQGTQYKTCHRTLPTVSFRKANDGSDTVKSNYRQLLKECSIIDAQIQLDKAVADSEASGSGPESTIEDLKFNEAQGVVMGTYITVGAQMYYGTTNDANGFAGIASVTSSLNAAKNTSPVVVGAGGSTASVQSSAYLIWENLQGAHFIFGNNSGFNMMPDWRVQQVLGNNSKPMTAYVNNLQGWIGFAVNHPLSVARIGNINKATDSKPLTDAIVAQALSYLPLQMRAEYNANLNGAGPSKFGPGLKLLMNGITAYGLQASRTSTTDRAGGVDGAQAYAKLPTESNGIPIILTDSIVNTEAVLT
jgi:hypothetical protein